MHVAPPLPCEQAPRARRFIPSIDGLRTVALLFVLLAHLRGTQNLGSPPGLKHLAGCGEFCVQLFFVISGYVISILLFREMERDGGISLGRFYLRRTLRIFPPFYAYLLVILVMNATGAVTLLQGDVLHAVTYTTNYHHQRAWPVGHFWTLSVEEQFYLVWPAVLLVFGERRGCLLAAAFVLIAPLVRIIEWQFFPSLHTGIGESFGTAADAIAIGCVLAGFRKELGESPLYLRLLRSPLIPLIPFAVLLGYRLSVDRPYFHFLLGCTFFNLCAALIMDRLIRFPDGWFGRFVNHKVVAYVGAMSYSIYLWQQLFLNRHSDAWYNAFPANLGLTLAAGVLSYHLVEHPAQRLRDFLEARYFRKGPFRAARPDASA